MVLTKILLPLTQALGIGADWVRLGGLLLPPGWSQELTSRGTWVFAGGRYALAPNGRVTGERTSAPIAAAVALCGELWQASEGEYYTLVQGRYRRAGLPPPEQAELGRVLLAAASLLLSGGWALELTER